MPPLSEQKLRERFDRILNSSDDAAVIVRKGHSLVEEMLDSYLAFIFHDKEAYTQAHLSFSQKFHLVLSHLDFSSWYEEDSEDEDARLVKLTFAYVASLDRLKNKLMHNAGYQGLEADMRVALGIDETVPASGVVKEIRSHIFYLYYYLQGFVPEASQYNEVVHQYGLWLRVQGQQDLFLPCLARTRRQGCIDKTSGIYHSQAAATPSTYGCTIIPEINSLLLRGKYMPDIGRDNHFGKFP